MMFNKLLFLFPLLCILQSSQCDNIGDNIYGANITVQPESINTTLNSTVVFHCVFEAVGSDAGPPDLIFEVDGEQATDFTADGFFPTSVADGIKVVGKMTVIAYDDNNNTNISCKIITYSLSLKGEAEPIVQHSDTALLMIQGLLDDVSNLSYTFINGSNVLLTWTPPYTLDNVPITEYLVNETEQTNYTNITLSTTDPERCKLYTVTVSAINDVGIGSSNNVRFYYPTVPLIIPAVSVSPTADEDGNLLLTINIYVSELCSAEYPNNIIVIILNVHNEIQGNYSIPPEVHNQMEIIKGDVSMPNNLTAFTVIVSMSNMGGEFLPIPPFKYAKVGPVTDIKPSPENCDVLNITWVAPHSSSNIYGYHFILSDNITGAVLIERHVFPQTNFQFPDPKLFSRHYKFVIAGVNKLGDGISREKIFSIQEVPKSVEGTSVHFIEQDRDNHDNAVYKLTIPIKLECAPKAPLHTNISILCNETDLVYENNSLVEYSFGENLTRVVSVPMHQQCNITIVFSNGAGQSESFILAFDTTTPVASTSTTPSSTQTPSPTKPPPNIGLIIGCVVAAVFLIVTCIVIAIIGYKCRKNCCKKCKK